MERDTVQMTIWHHCYSGGGWSNRMLCPEAFSHPAKFSRGLIERIVEHGLERGYWKVRETIGDPMAGVGCGGIIAAYHGLAWVGVELEPRFVKLAEQNFKLHRRKWDTLGVPQPRIVQGDARQFARIVKSVAGICTSPPYVESIAGKGDGINWGRIAGEKSTNARTTGRGAIADGYGQTPGQIASLPAGKLDGIATSPPYEGTTGHPSLGHPELHPNGHGILTHTTTGAKPGDECFGNASGQIGNEQREDYWSAMRLVYQQCYLALKPGGVMAVVIKDYVKDKQRVPLCDQTWDLLVSAGFKAVERIRAMLVEETEHPSLFGGKIVKRKERKSFFRRLTERKGSPRIDWEQVLWLRR